MPTRHRPFISRFFFLFLLGATVAQLSARAQDKPYFVTYSHDLEEPGEFEIETKTATAQPDTGDQYGASAMELEYGVRAWWTSELYLDWQATGKESALFTGYRIENRIRPSMRERAINPVLYIEYENISAADKTVLEVVGHDGQDAMYPPNWKSQRERQHEGEFKLILSSNLRSWNIAENFIAEKNLGHSPWEFGYAVGAARPLHSTIPGRECTWCAEKFMVGAEVYGGLGDVRALTIRDTSHYLGPLIGWQLPRDMRLSFSPGFGLTETSLDRIYRIGFAVGLGQVSSWFHPRNLGAE